MVLKEWGGALDRGLQVFRPLPLPQHLDIGRQRGDLLTDHLRVLRVVAGA